MKGERGRLIFSEWLLLKELYKRIWSDILDNIRFLYVLKERMKTYLFKGNISCKIFKEVILFAGAMPHH